jgi:hypothetical protein
MTDIVRTIEAIPSAVVLAIQQHFHSVILGRAAVLVEQHKVTLPDLGVYAKGENEKRWLPIPGMCGGFAYHFERGGEQALLVSASWCRVVGGSGQRHHITAEGSALVESGFV